MSNGLTKEECKRILFKIGIKFGVSPKLISERLLHAEDKCDMLNGEMPVEYLEVAVQAWQDAGMPDYSHSLAIPLCEEIKTGLNRHPARQEPTRLPYRKPFVVFSEIPKD